MASILIGGKNYTIPEMNFVAIERSWPYVELATSTLDPVDGISAALGVFAAGLMEAEGFKPEDFNVEPYSPHLSDETKDAHTHKGVIYFLKKSLKGIEMDKVRETMFQVLKEAGLEVTEGEARQAFLVGTGQETTSPSPETAPDISSSSLPLDAKEDLGTS